jgi:UDP-N-acetyl-D-glucosamine dehydrogenase
MNLEETKSETYSKNCLVEIYGLGYVGLPLSIRLASSGFYVKGLDIDEKKIHRLNNKILTHSEQFFQDEFNDSLESKNLTLSVSPQESDKPKIAIICVPTPISNNISDSNIFLKNAVSKFLSFCKKGDIIILESSIQIGTTKEIKDLIESKGYVVGSDIGLCYCPERIDPMNKDWTLENIPRVIYSSDDITFSIAKNVYRYVNNSRLIRVENSTIAELVKSYENSFRLINISFVNELSILCEKLKIDVNDVITAASTKPFGFMSFYPSAGAGGHCIPKDPTFLTQCAKDHGIKFPTIEAALNMNTEIRHYITDSIEKTLTKLNLEKKILVCGLAYKPDIEDMRDSPGIKLIKELKDRNFLISAHDPYYDKKLHEKYIKENNFEKLDFDLIHDLNDSTIKKFNCICIVQFHSSTKPKLNTIYKKSLVPFIYDCQKKLIKNPKSTTILNFDDNEIP